MLIKLGKETLNVSHKYNFIFIFIIWLFFILSSCSEPKKVYIPSERYKHIKVVLVLPWDLYLSSTEKVFPSPVRGIVSGPLESFAQETMNELLKKELLSLKTSYQFVFLSPVEFESLIGNILEDIKTPEEVIKSLAQKTRADAILYGKIYRFKERKGKGFAAKEPASVAFTIVLYEGSSGKILWYELFDETQKPLSENLLNLSLYGKIKWLTAKELAERGLNRILKSFPK